MENTNSFKFSMPILKTYIDKATKKRIVEGLASGTELDLCGDRMSENALKTMRDSLNDLLKKSGTLNVEHQQGWAYEIGDIIDLTIDGGNNLIMKAALDESPMADTLWYRLTKQGKKIGLSIEGIVNSFRNVRDENSGDYIRVFEDVSLDGIAVTSSPAYPLTYLSAIAKSVNGIKSSFNKKNSMVIEENNVAKTTEETEAVVKTEEVMVEEATKEADLSEVQNYAEETKTEQKSEDGVEAESSKEDSTETKVEVDNVVEVSAVENAEVDKEEKPVVEEKQEEAKATEVVEENVVEEEVKKDFVTKQDFEELKSLVVSMKDMITKSTEKPVEEVKEEPKEEEKQPEEITKSEVEQLKETIESLKTEMIAMKSLKDEMVTLKSKVSSSTTNRRVVELDKFEGEGTNVVKSMEQELEEKAEELRKSRRFNTDWFAESGKIKRRHGVI